MTDESTTDEADLVWQPRCPNCLVEHYLPNTVAISTGQAACGICGHRQTFANVEDYRAALRAARDRQEQRRTGRPDARKAFLDALHRQERPQARE